MVLLEKRGQVTTFIVIGLVLLLLSTIIIFFTVQRADMTKPATQLDIAERDALVSFVTSCIEKTARPVADKLIQNAGQLAPNRGRMYEGIFYPYLCVQDKKSGCRPVLITRQTIEDQLNKGIGELLSGCLDFSSFEEEGYRINIKAHTITTNIASDTIDVSVNKPITVEKDNKQFTAEEFRTTIRSDLGRLFDLMIQIIHEEIQNDFFDEDAWMIDHGEEIEIRKHKPYPDTVYELTHIDPETLNLQHMYFALQGRDTSSYRGNQWPPVQKSQGYCHITRDNTCYANVDAQTCGINGGEWLSKPFPDFKCPGLTVFSGSTCVDGQCDSCGEHKHGQSWCVYDGVVGSGFDAVGSRHYKQSCINGKIYTSECRDYRDEFCTEVGTKAVCRKNRWEDCVSQEDQESCEDSTVRDCYWNEWLYKASYFRGPSQSFENRRCIPVVPPGSKHWLGESQTLCNVANEQFNCDGIKCPMVWVDSAAVYCYQMGDCGDYFQKDGDFGIGGYENSAYDERVYVYNIPFDTVFNTHVSQPLFSFKQAALTGFEYDFEQSTYNVMNRNFVTWKKRAVQNKVFPNIFAMFAQVVEGKDPTKIDADTLHTAYCNVWSESRTDESCSSCSDHPWKPCSEYKCKSIGNHCRYVEENGFGSCVEQLPKPEQLIVSAYLLDKDLVGELKEVTPEKMNIVGESLTVIEDLSGYTISETIEPYDVVAFVIESVSSKPPVCRQISGGDLFNPLYQPSATGNMQMLYFLATPLQTQSSSQDVMIDLPKIDNLSFEGIDEQNPLIQAQLDQLGSQNEKFKGITFSQLREMLQNPSLFPAQDELKNLQKLHLQQSFYEKGNVQQSMVTCGVRKPFSVQFKVGKTLRKPRLLKVEPPQNTKVNDQEQITLHLDRPASCSTNDKSIQFECEDVFSSTTGKFTCSQLISFNEQKDLNVLCQSPPRDMRGFIFNVQKGENEHANLFTNQGTLELHAVTLGPLYQITTLTIPQKTTLQFLGSVMCRKSDKQELFDTMKQQVACTGTEETVCTFSLPEGSTYVACETKPQVLPPQEHFELQWE